MANDQISLPYLLVILVLSGLIIRYLFFSSPPTTRHSAARDANMQRTREAAVERIQQMFPQVDRRTILWDLQRNGGNIQTTSDRILSGRLETPPVTFQPPPPPQSSTGSASAAQTQKQPDKPTQPDLITRYNLQSRIGGEPAAAAVAEAPRNQAKGWSSNREERQTLLQRRRDEMILEARRKMEAKIAAENAGSR